MKKLMLFLALIMGSFSLISSPLPVHTEPESPNSKTEVNAKLSDDLSEYCKPDWSGYDTLSPDISTRSMVYPDKKKIKKKEKHDKTKAMK